MKVDQMFPSKFIKGADLPGPKTVIIEKIVKERSYKPGQGQVDIFVLWCEKATCGVVLSRPLALSIAEAINENDTDKWGGKSVVLYPLPMTVAGRSLVAIRARAVAPQPAQPQPKTTEEKGEQP